MLHSMPTWVVSPDSLGPHLPGVLCLSPQVATPPQAREEFPVGFAFALWFAKEHHISQNIALPPYSMAISVNHSLVLYFVSLDP